MNDAEKTKPEDETVTAAATEEPDTELDADDLDDADLDDTDEDEAPAEAPAEEPAEEITSAEEVKSVMPDAPPPPVGVKWSELGPRLWKALHGLLAGDKEKHDDKYVITASHDAVADAHDAIDQ